MTDALRPSALSLSRRNVMHGMAAMTILPFATIGAAQATENSDYYFFPASRIGFKRPEGLQQRYNLWALGEQFGTFSVSVTESLRLKEEAFNHLWNRDSRYQILSESKTIDGLETRHFRMKYSDPNGDYSTEMLAIRDERWIGELTVENHPLGELKNPASGLNAQWRQKAQDILATVTIRPPLPIDQIFAAIGISLEVPELHPRLIGDTLIFSTYAPENVEQEWGANFPVIQTSSVMIIPPGKPEDQAKLNNLYEATFMKMPGAKVLKGPSCHGVLSREVELVQGLFGRFMEVFGPTRSLRFSASYDEDRRQEMNDALLKILQAIRLA